MIFRFGSLSLKRAGPSRPQGPTIYIRNIHRNRIISNRFFSNSNSNSNSGTHECWNCGTVNSTSDLFCKAEDCKRIQNVDPKNVNYFHMFSNPNQTFNVDLKELEGKFKNLQKQLHPDKFATKSISEKNYSAAASSMVNQAYQVLKSPMDRVNYILMSKLGINILDETSTTVKDPVLMSEMFLLRETASELTSKEDMAAFISDREQELYKLGVSLDELMERHDSAVAGLSRQVGEEAFAAQYKLKEEIKEVAVRMKYLSKVLVEMENRLEPPSE